MRVWVASYPRSGNTLILCVLRDVFGIDRIGSVFEEGLGLEQLRIPLPPGSARSPKPFRLPAELAGLSNDDLLDAIHKRVELFFIKTHNAEHAASDGPAIYAVRDGRDAICSFAHYVEARGTPRYQCLEYNRRLAMLIGQHPTYGSWSQNVRAWSQRGAPTAIVRFEDLVEDPVAVVTGACRSLDVELPEPRGELAPFSYMQKYNPPVFRRGDSGIWRTEMPTHIQNRFWARHGDEMEALGYHHDSGSPGADSCERSSSHASTGQ